MHPTVRPETAAAVRKAAEEIGYVHPTVRRRTPHGLPVSLKRVAIVTLGMAQSLSRLPIVAELLEGASEEARRRNLTVVFSDVPDLMTVPAVLLDRAVDGVLIKAGLQGTAEEWRTPAVRAATALPFVWLSGRPAGCSGDMVGSDDDAAGRLAAEHLVACGHRHLAFLSPKSDHRLFLDREMAFTWRAQQLGAKTVSFLGGPGTAKAPIAPVSEVGPIRELLDKLLRHTPRPTAVFVPADSVAALLYRTMAERGLKVGRDLSVVSCNHERLICEGLHPALTTIDIYSREIGARGLDQLYWRAAHPEDPRETTVTITPSLVEGASVKKM
jgi:LacI family transcriptional regulator